MVVLLRLHLPLNGLAVAIRLQLLVNLYLDDGLRVALDRALLHVVLAAGFERLAVPHLVQEGHELR